MWPLVTHQNVTIGLQWEKVVKPAMETPSGVPSSLHPGDTWAFGIPLPWFPVILGVGCCTAVFHSLRSHQSKFTTESLANWQNFSCLFYCDLPLQRQISSLRNSLRLAHNFVWVDSPMCRTQLCFVESQRTPRVIVWIEELVSLRWQVTCIFRPDSVQFTVPCENLIFRTIFVDWIKVLSLQSNASLRVSHNGASRFVCREKRKKILESGDFWKLEDFQGAEPENHS